MSQTAYVIESGHIVHSGTGVAGGIGRALARAFVNVGLCVGLMDVDHDADAAVAAQPGGDRAIGLRGDVGDPGSAADGIARTCDHFGALDVLVNNAGLGLGVVRADHFIRVVQIEYMISGTFLPVPPPSSGWAHTPAWNWR